LKLDRFSAMAVELKKRLKMRARLKRIIG